MKESDSSDVTDHSGRGDSDGSANLIDDEVFELELDVISSLS